MIVIIMIFMLAISMRFIYRVSSRPDSQLIDEHYEYIGDDIFTRSQLVQILAFLIPFVFSGCLLGNIGALEYFCISIVIFLAFAIELYISPLGMYLLPRIFMQLSLGFSFFPSLFVLLNMKEFDWPLFYMDVSLIIPFILSLIAVLVKAKT